jgi:hypothetical protein
MNAVIAIIVRELGSRRELFLLAAAVAVMISLLPFLPNIEGYEATDVRTVASSISALALGFLLALLFGATIFGNDLSEGRLGFFFCRPVSGIAVWWGRTLAAIVLVWAVELIVLVPSFFGAESYVFAVDRLLGWSSIAAFVLAPVVLFLVAHALSIMVRARTAWLLLDVAGVITVGIVAVVNLRPLHEAGAEIAFWVVAGAMTAALLIALAMAGSNGVAVGRVDLRRAHGALSSTLWGTVVVSMAAVSVYGNWLRNYGPQDFDDVDVQSIAPDGEWAEVVGGAPGRLDVTRRCLISTTDGRWLPLPRREYGFPDQVIYSSNGATAMWFGVEVDGGLRALSWADLGRPDPTVRQSTVFLSRDAQFTLSADGTRFAVFDNGTLSVFEADGERLVTAVKLPEDLRQATVFFPSNDTLRIFFRRETGDEFSLGIAAVDAATGKINRTGQIENLAGDSLIAVDAGLKNLVTWSRPQVGRAPIRCVYDASSGGLVRLLEDVGFPRFLQDGRVLLSSWNRGEALTLTAEPIEAGDQVTHTVDDAAYINLHGEVVPNGIAFSQLEDPSDRTEGRRVDVLDVNTGELDHIAQHLRRGLPWFPWQRGDAGTIVWYRNQMEASRFFIDRSGALVRWDPETGDLVHVVGGST